MPLFGGSGYTLGDGGDATPVAVAPGPLLVPDGPIDMNRKTNSKLDDISLDD